MSSWTMPFAFVLKILVGCFFLFVYSYNYGDGNLTADAGVFLKESKILNSVFYESPSAYFKFLFGFDDEQLVLKHLIDTNHWDAGPSTLLNDSKNVLRFHSVVHFFSFGQTFIHLMISCFLSLIGVQQLTLAIRHYSTIKINAVFLLILLMPNVVFWTSGIIKEPFLFLGVALLARALLDTLPTTNRLLVGLIGLLLLIGFKPYVLLCILPAIGVYFIFHFIKRPIVAFAVLACCIVASLTLILTNNATKIVQNISAKQYDFVNVGRGGIYARGDTCIYIINNWNRNNVTIKGDSVYLTKEIDGEYMMPYQKTPSTKATIYPNEKAWILYYNGPTGGSFIEVDYIANSPVNLIKNIPHALFNVLFRPTPMDPPMNYLKWLSIFDNWIILGFLVWAIIRKRQIGRNELNLLIAIVIFCILLTLVIGWTTPVIGAIVRYKIPVQIGLMLIAIILYSPKKYFLK